MNLSDFALLKEQNDSYVIGHPKGKSIQVSKQGLSDRAKELISKLKKHENFDEGGDVPSLNSGNFNEQIETTPALEQGLQGVQQAYNLSVADNPTLTMAQRAANNPLASRDVSSTAITEPSVTSNAELQASDQAQAQPSATVPPTPSPEASPALPGLPIGTNNPYGEAAKAIQGSIEAQQNVGKATEAAQKAYQEQSDAAKGDYDTTVNTLRSQQNNLQMAISQGKIDPNRLWNNASFGQKAQASIGLVLAGIGAGLTHGPNLALEVMNKNIQNDIDAQMHDQSKNMNLYKMNREALGDSHQAYLTTMGQLQAHMLSSISQAQAQAMGPEAAGRLAQLKASFEQQAATTTWMNGMLRGSSTGASPGTEQDYMKKLTVMDQLNPAMGKDLRKRTIPSIGVAERDVPEDTQKAFTSYDDLNKQIDRAINFAKTQGTTINPLGKSAQEAKDIQNNLQLEYGNLIGLKRINEFEAGKYQENIKNPGAWNTTQAIQSFTDFKNLIASRRASEMKSFNVHPFQQAPQDAKAIAWAHQNPGTPQATRIKQLHGIQ